MTGQLEVLYQDAWVLAVNKPSGLAVHRGWAAEHDTVVSRVRGLVGQPVHPVHRLDRATSGVLLFALDPESLRALSRCFAQGQVQKSYLALVRGEPPVQGLIDHPVPRTESRQGQKVEARTRFRKLQRSPRERCTLIEAQPLTGRLHQIRRHFKHLSHPLIRDTRYGKGEINRHYRARYHFHRLALHAQRLEVPHPNDGGTLHLTAGVPGELSKLLQSLEIAGFEVPGPTLQVSTDLSPAAGALEPIA